MAIEQARNGQNSFTSAQSNPFGDDQARMNRMKQFDNNEDYLASLTPEERAYEKSQENSAVSMSSQGNAGRGGAPSSNQDQVFGGMFNLKGVMDSFYNYKPGANDETGAAIKNTFASNMIQSAFDQQMAMQMAEFQAGIGTQNMETAANLELRNNSSLMQQEFNSGMASMGAQFDYQNQFANAQYDRDIGMLGATGEQTRKNQDNETYNQNLQTIVAGEQQRQNTALQGGIDIDRSNIAADASKFGAQQAADASKYGAQQSAEASKYGADASADASKFGAQTSADASKYGADASKEASMYGAKQSADASKFGAQASKDASMYGADKSAEASKYGADKSSQASMYGSDKAAEASMYGAKQSADASKFGAQASKDASMYSADKSSQASMYGADASKEASMYGADASKEASMYGADKSAEASMYGADASKEASMYGADKSSQASMYGADKSLEGIKYGADATIRNTTETGKQQRLSADQANTFAVDKENRQQARSRAGARRF